MPNWCNNELTVSGPTADVLKIKEILNSESPFQLILPEPTELAGQEGFNKGGREWRVSNWGTKWDIELEEEIILDKITDEQSWFLLHFDTAWSPPAGIFRTLMEQYPDVNFTLFYREDGMQIAGYL